MSDLYEIPVDSLELSVRSANCLRNYGIKTAGHMIDFFSQHSKAEVLKKIKNFGAKSYWEVMYLVESFSQKPEAPEAPVKKFYDFLEDEARKRDFDSLQMMLLYSIAVSAKRIADEVCGSER